jgi:hypothetical protein
MAGLLMFMCVRRIGLTNRAADASDLGYGSLADIDVCVINVCFAV